MHYSMHLRREGVKDKEERESDERERERERERWSVGSWGGKLS